MKMESDVVSKIKIQFCALKFLTLLEKSLAKLVDMVKGMSSTGLVCKKNSSQALSDLLRSSILGLLPTLRWWRKGSTCGRSDDGAGVACEGSFRTGKWDR